MDTDVARRVQHFFEKYPQRHFKKGQIIVYKDEDPGGVYYLVRGEVRQYDITDAGFEVVANVFKPPAFFPMSWAIQRSPNTYFFETGNDVLLHVAPADEVLAFLKENPDVMFDLLRRLYSGVDGLQRRMTYLMGSPARIRIIYELVITCRRFGVKNADGYAVMITGAELASRTGLARETVSRELHELENKGLLHVGYKTVRIKKLSSLEKMLA